jgi:hypothetical protein
MSENTFPDSEILAFRSNWSFVYGTRISIVSEPEKRVDDWVVYVVDESLEHKEIYLDDNQIVASSYIILRCSPIEGRGYEHYAVLAEALDEASEKIEDMYTPLFREDRM